MEACAGCGLTVVGGADGCQALFHQLWTREDLRNGLPYPIRRKAVDVYCLQHPDSYCVSAKSLAAHLTGLCWALEHGGGSSGLAALQRWLNGPAKISKPALPTSRGGVTIADVMGTEQFAVFGRTVDRWALATWAAYSGLHETARRWVDEAISGAGR